MAFSDFFSNFVLKFYGMWGKYNKEQNKVFKWKIGEITLYVLPSLNECKLGLNRIIGEHQFEFSTSANEVIPTEVNWQRFITDKSDFIHFQPAMPNRAVLLKPHSDVNILPGKKCWFYIPIPLWLQIYIGTEPKQNNLLIDESIIELSSTWFGEPDNGILSYSLNTEVFYHPDEIPTKEHTVICSMQVSNQTDSILKIDRLLIQTEYLKIYADKNELFTNEISVKYEGELNPSFTQFGKNPPSIAKDAKLLAEERIIPSENLLRRSYLFFKSGKKYLNL